MHKNNRFQQIVFSYQIVEFEAKIKIHLSGVLFDIFFYKFIYACRNAG